MAVTISVAELVDELRVGSSPEELAKVTRLHGYASEAVIRHASGATDAAHNEAVVRLAAYLYDQPSVTRADGFSNALRSSGAARILLPYRIHRAGTTAEAVTVAEQSGSVDNPVIDVSVVSNTLTVVYSDGTSASFPLASGSGDAQSIVDAHAMEANAHHVPPAGVGQGITQAALDTAIETHTDAATAHHAPPTHGTELALKVERADVSAGVGIAVSAVPNSQTAFTISTTGSAGGPTELQRQWEFRTQTPNPIAGEVVYDGTALVGEIDTWRFNTGTGYADARTELLDLASGDMVEISQTASRHQTITVTSTPTISGNIVTVSGRADRALSGQIPGSGQGVTVTLIPGPIQGVDQTARDSVTDHEGTAHNTDTMARETAMRASDKVDTHVLNHPMGTDTTARASAAAAQADIDDHEANHPGGGDGGAFVLGNVADGRLPLPPVTMRIAWIESGDVVTSATFGPLASVGDTTQTRAPDFPQAYLDDGLGAAVIVFWSATTGLVPLVYPLDRYEIVSGPGTVLNVDGEHGTYWTTDVVFSRHAEGDRFSLQFPGELIATESWVEEQIDAIPGGGGGGGGTSAAWDWLGHVSGGAWLAGTARTVGYSRYSPYWESSGSMGSPNRNMAIHT